MAYDFTTIYNRHNMDSISQDVDDGEFSAAAQEKRIPLWVADMGFATAPAVTEHIRKRMEHPVYGYFLPSDEYYGVIARWHRESYGWNGPTKETTGYENGVLGGVASALRLLAAPGSPILLHSPTYNGFIHVLEDLGYRMVLSPLKKDGRGVSRMDLRDMEKKIKDNNIHVVLFCSPHNPSGRVWAREELEDAMKLFAKYDLTVISDEIWSDLTLYGNTHIPTASVSADAAQRTIAFYAPTKTFNLAGMIGSYSVVLNPRLRKALTEAEEKCHYNNMNVLSMHALIGAYSPEGRAWMNELKKVLEYNTDTMCAFFSSIDGVSVFKSEGTYIISPDFSKWSASNNTSVSELVQKGIATGVMWRDGKYYNMPDGIRLCLSQPSSLIREAVERLRPLFV